MLNVLKINNIYHWRVMLWWKLETHAPVLARASKNVALCMGVGRKKCRKSNFSIKASRVAKQTTSWPLFSGAYVHRYFCSALSVRRLFISATKDTHQTKNREPKFELPLPFLEAIPLSPYACKYFHGQIEISLYQYGAGFFIALIVNDDFIVWAVHCTST
jgi:hypothetical protein